MAARQTMTSLSSSSSPLPPPQTFKIYPISQWNKLKQSSKNLQRIHILRHAQGFHNIGNDYRNPKNLDATLSPKGHKQCQTLAGELAQRLDLFKDGKNNDNLVVISSTMTRCIQTALESCSELSLSANDNNARMSFLAHEDIRETVNYVCDQRRPLSKIKAEFPMIDFLNFDHEDDMIWEYYQDRLGPQWTKHRESAELYKVARRGRSFFQWLTTTNMLGNNNGATDQHVLLCTHSAFLRCILNWGCSGGVPQKVPQMLDDRNDPEPDTPIFEYCGDADFEQAMRSDFANCELRSMILGWD